MSKFFHRNGVRTINFALPKPDVEIIKMHWREFVCNISPYPNNYKGKGIVICAGGKKYFTCCWVLINVLRNELKCNLPIQVWYKGNEITQELAYALSKLDVTSHNLEDYYPELEINSYAIKPAAILLSSFKEILYLDADNICTLNPDILFELPEYKKSGAIFWPDFWITDKNNQIWEIIDIQANNEKEQESGQILINKEQCWSEINLAFYFNLNSHIYYNFLIGDKDTFRFAWLALKKPFCFIKQEVSLCGYFEKDYSFIGHTMGQHIPDGDIAFLHRNLLKWDQTDTNERTWVKVKQFETNALKKEYLLYRDSKKLHSIMDLDGDIMVLDFKTLFGDLEIKCLEYLQSLREEKFYKKLFLL